ncbi:hypothetical protein Ahy_A10g048511 [Arachis hypogaea]|uniref:EF-hand domain-containing protein n=1 Tax=Arachis hypogaea TaxID=3818 RepID=A0A445B5B6_ARAHY|nr:hypothetical protein Ahy_A10g048511 [Arachis hypogaea]
MEFNPVPIGSCSKENQIIYQQFFNYADSDGDGRITGSDATKFFAMSNLSRQDLKQVWLLLIQSDKDLLVLQSSSLLCRHFTSNHFSGNLPATFANLTKLNHVYNWLTKDLFLIIPGWCKGVLHEMRIEGNHFLPSLLEN